MQTKNTYPMTDTARKLVEYAYPSSDNAKQFGFYHTGCWCVKLVDGPTDYPHAVGGFATRREAMLYSEFYPCRWDLDWLKYKHDYLDDLEPIGSQHR